MSKWMLVRMRRVNDHTPSRVKQRNWGWRFDRGVSRTQERQRRSYARNVSFVLSRLEIWPLFSFLIPSFRASFSPRQGTTFPLENKVSLVGNSTMVSCGFAALNRPGYAKARLPYAYELAHESPGLQPQWIWKFRPFTQDCLFSKHLLCIRS